MLPPDFAEFAAEFGSVAELSEPLDDAEGDVIPPLLLAAAALLGVAAELSEPLTGAEGEVIPPLLLAVAALLGLAALFGAMLLFALPVVEPLVPESWANAAGAKDATDNAKPAPSK